MLLRPQIPHYRGLLSSCVPDPFGMTDEFEASVKRDCPDIAPHLWGLRHLHRDCFPVPTSKIAFRSRAQRLSAGFGAFFASHFHRAWCALANITSTSQMALCTVEQMVGLTARPT